MVWFDPGITGATGAARYLPGLDAAGIWAHVNPHHRASVAFIRGAARNQGMDTGAAVNGKRPGGISEARGGYQGSARAADGAEVTVVQIDGTRHNSRIDSHRRRGPADRQPGILQKTLRTRGTGRGTNPIRGL